MRPRPRAPAERARVGWGRGVGHPLPARSPAHCAGYARAKAEAADWPPARTPALVRRRQDVLEVRCRHDSHRSDWLDEEAGILDALTDLLLAHDAAGAPGFR